jgi:hypothetical protein
LESGRGSQFPLTRAGVSSSPPLFPSLSRHRIVLSFITTLERVGITWDSQKIFHAIISVVLTLLALFK